MLQRALWIFLCIADLAVWAQSTGAIVGNVQDPSKAVVAQVQIRVVNDATGEAFKTTSDDAGRFEFPRLPVGTYTLAAESPGFKQYLVHGIRVDADQTRQAAIALELGQTTEAVSVSGAVALVETVGGTLRETVDERRINELPLNGRNPLQLQLLVPGVVTNNGAAVNLAQNPPVSVNGARGNESNYMLDGGDNNDPLTNTASIVPNPDALEEFSILTNNFSAEYGRNSGGAVNAITKSGTNDIHGSVYEFVRNDAFDARNFFSLIKPILKRNQFGASFGGPVLIPHLYSGVNRTFFFLSWESLRESDASTVSGAVVPTALERAGDFSQSKNKPVDPATKVAFPGAIVPSIRFNPASVNFLNTLIPLPNGPNGQYIYNAPTFNNSDQGMARVDHLLTGKQHLMLRAFVDRTGSQDNGGLPLLNASVKFNTQNFVANHTYTISPNLLNVVQFTYGRVDLYRTPLPVLNGVTYQSLGVNAPSDTPQYPTNWRGGVTGFWNMSQDNLVGINRKTFQISDSFTYIHGAHTMKFGGEFRRTLSNRVTANLTDPQFTFNGQATTNAFADFLIGLPSVMNQGSLRVNAGRSIAWDLFAQDDWKITRRLTLSLGVRYEPFYPLYDAENQLSVFRPGEQSTVFPSAPSGLLFGGDPGVPRGGVDPGYNHVAPRFGFAWQPTANGKTSIRGAYGIFYETPNYYQLTAFANTQPYSIQQMVNSPASFSNPYTGLVDPFPYHPPTTAEQRQAFKFLLPVTIGESIDPNLVGGYMQQWNFNIQHETFGNIVLTAGYVGSKGTHLPLQVELNPAVYAPGATLANVNSRRVYGTSFASIADYASIGDSTYHALQLSLNKRFSHGFTILASYTYAKSIDNGSTDTLGGWQNPRNLKAEKAVSDFDVPRRFVGSFLWALPAPSKGIARMFLGHWQWNGIVTLQSGTPVNIVSGQDRYLAGTGAQRPNLVGDPAVSNPNITQWYNPAAFALPALGTYGNVGRNILFGPGSKNVDLSLFREFKLIERFQLQFRAEAFNSLNHANFANPVATFTSANAGRILSAADPRILQFALRLTF